MADSRTPPAPTGTNRQDPRVLGWIREAVQEGDAFLRSATPYTEIDLNMNYISGRQQPNVDNPLPRYLQPLVLNMCRKAVQAHVSALTDLKPTGGYKSFNPKYQYTADLLNQLLVATWINQMMDRPLGDTVKIALAAGSADMGVEWNPSLPNGGDHVFIPRDPRDTLPIRPGQARDPQLWAGATFREVWTVNDLRAKYPWAASHIAPTREGLLQTVKGLFRRTPIKFQSPADPLSLLQNRPMTMPVQAGDVVLYKTYLQDRTRNLTANPVVVGDPTSNWSITAQPGDFLYPTRRLILSIMDEKTGSGLILYDGPNPYWHGMIPNVRLSLWSLPWEFFGLPLLNDLRPLQDAINDGRSDIRLGVKQWLDRGTVMDTHAVSSAASKLFDARKPGQRFKLRGTAVDTTKAVHMLEGPNAQALALASTQLDLDIQRFEKLSGTANLEQLMQLRQMPSGDTIQKYFEALTPEIRQEGRELEAFLKDTSALLKVNMFQFMSAKRRVLILGDAGIALNDFDFDPEMLVPALKRQIPGQPLVPGMPPPLVENPAYDPEFDADLPRERRARVMSEMMAFVVAPNSLLAMHAQEAKMTKFQLARMGYLDFWSLLEALEVANVGTPPKIPLPPLHPPPTDQIALAEAMLTGQYTLGPMGEILELREPMTITERLQAQQLLGIGMTENPAGRKASGDQPPKMEQKTDETGAPRQTITESQK